MTARDLPVSPLPFVAWLDEQVVRLGLAEALHRVGWASDVDTARRRLDRWRTETETVEALDVYDALHMAGVSFGDVYDAPEFAATRARLEDAPEPLPGRKRGKPVGSGRKLTDAQVRAAHKLYAERGLSLRQLGALIWERFGFASPASAANCLSVAFIQLDLPRRERIAATVAASTIHGNASRADRAASTESYRQHRRELRVQRGAVRLQRCAGTRTQAPRRGAPCGRWALEGSEYCWNHDPARRAEVLAIITDARDRIGAAA